MKRVMKKRQLSLLLPEQKSSPMALQESKQVSRFLMPDAPPRKQKCKVSPPRIPCPLTPGTPSVPPPRIPQPWETPPTTPSPTCEEPVSESMLSPQTTPSRSRHVDQSFSKFGLAMKKRQLSLLTPEQKSSLMGLRESNQVSRFLMPDAPPRKQKCQVSPPRIPCPLTPGTPSVPPPRIPQPWETPPTTPSPTCEEGDASSSGGTRDASGEPSENPSQTQEGPSTSRHVHQSFREFGLAMKKSLSKRQLSRLTPKQKSRLMALEESKQVGRFLMPKAPPRKQKRKVSPPRIPCPLTPGTPSVPPPRIPQPWETPPTTPSPTCEEGDVSSSGGTRDASGEPSENPSQTQAGPSTARHVHQSFSEFWLAMKKSRRRQLRRLTPKQKSRLMALEESKQVGRFLIPKAPPRKQNRKVSPPRIPCPLTPGTPSVPPPRIPQPWETPPTTPSPTCEEGDASSSGGTRDTSGEPSENPSQSQEGPST